MTSKAFFDRLGQGADAALTLLGGDRAGERALLKNGQFFYRQEGGFFASLSGVDSGEAAGARTLTLGGEPVFYEPLRPQRRLAVMGAGHVGLCVISLGRMLDFEIVCFEDRPDFAEKARQAGAHTVLTGPFEACLASFESDEETFFVSLTRDHAGDEACLRAVLQKPHAYVGMMGSAKRSRVMREKLIASGMDPAAVEEICAPVGLPIGAETPEEIAVSILAQIIEKKNRQSQGFGYPEALLSAIRRSRGPLVMATITERTGSAPRMAGTRMLVDAGGKLSGTIGGGILEELVRQRALSMLSEGRIRAESVRFDLSGGDGDGQMLCGGVVTVFLEGLCDEAD